MMGLDTSLMREFSVRGRCMHTDFNGIRRNGKSIKTLLMVLFPGNCHDHCLLHIPMLYPSPIFM